MAKKKKSGICKLTGRPGFFVDSHIIPLSLTRLSNSGKKVIEAQLDTPKRLRFNGWYDNELVVRTGEDILADIDSKAIVLLRENQLIWSSFSEDKPLSDLVLNEGHQPYRALVLGDAKELRLFFISLLWRAAASSRSEFKEINLDDHLVQSLRAKLLAKDPGLLSEFPVQLFQIITKGPRHNRSPILESKPVFGFDGEIKGNAKFVRFYLDGLVAHVLTSFDCDLPPEYLATCLGGFPYTLVFAHTFEQSRTYSNIRELVANHGRVGREKSRSDASRRKPRI